MARSRHVHDRSILDALEAIEPQPFQGDVWRVTRKGREPLRGSSARGRWSSNGDFEVLYTSITRDGALSEIGFRLSLEPIWPSKLEHQLHRIEAQSARTLHFVDVAALGNLGVDVARYESFDYRATQAIAAAAHFLEFDGLRVPSARAPCSNLVFFLDRLSDGVNLELRGSEPIDWQAWRDGHRA